MCHGSSAEEALHGFSPDTVPRESDACSCSSSPRSPVLYSAGS